MVYNVVAVIDHDVTSCLRASSPGIEYAKSVKIIKQKRKLNIRDLICSDVHVAGDGNSVVHIGDSLQSTKKQNTHAIIFSP